MTMESPADRFLRFLVQGFCGAALAAAIAVCVLLFWFTTMNWLIVGLAGITGFALGGILGENATEFFELALRVDSSVAA